MSGFVEKTVAEKGFASSWDLHVGADLLAAVKQRHRRMLFASLTSGISIGLVMVPVFLKGIVPEDSIFAQPLYVVLFVALATVASITGWITLRRPGAELEERVWEAVEAHFASLFSRDDNHAFAEVIIQDLATEGVLDAGAHKIKALSPALTAWAITVAIAAPVTSNLGNPRFPSTKSQSRIMLSSTVTQARIMGVRESPRPIMNPQTTPENRKKGSSKPRMKR